MTSVKNKISAIKEKIKSKKPKKPVVVRGFSDDAPYEYEQGGEFNEGAGMFASGGELVQKKAGNSIILMSGRKQYAKIYKNENPEYGWMIIFNPTARTSAALSGYNSSESAIKRAEQMYKESINAFSFESGGATDFVNEGAGMFAKGGIFGSREYKRGLAYKLDRAKHNKSEKWEKPLNQRSRYYEGGEMDEMKPKLSEDVLMLLSQVKQIKHHADEILEMVNSDGHIDSWVIAKAERSATDISDIYHYLDGRKDIFWCGGNLEYGGAIVDYSYGLLADPRFDVQSPVFEQGGDILAEDTVARVDDPAFADVGQYIKGGKTDTDILKTYIRNEDRNLHSENVVLLAKHFGTKEDLAKAKEILRKHDDIGYLSSELYEERSELDKKLYPKLVQMNFDILNFEG